MRKDILTADAQAQLTPELVLENLKKGINESKIF